MLIEEPPIRAASPQLAHREDKRVERHEQQSDQREREENFQQGKGVARLELTGLAAHPAELDRRGQPGMPGPGIEGPVSPFHLASLPWISRIRVRVSSLSLLRSAGSIDQVGRSSVNF